MNEPSKITIPKGESYWIKGSSTTFIPGVKLFDCKEQFTTFGCDSCPKRGLISVCHFYFLPPQTMADVEQQTTYKPNWET